MQVASRCSVAAPTSSRPCQRRRVACRASRGAQPAAQDGAQQPSQPGRRQALGLAAAAAASLALGGGPANAIALDFVATASGLLVQDIT